MVPILSSVGGRGAPGASAVLAVLSAVVGLMVLGCARNQCVADPRSIRGDQPTAVLGRALSALSERGMVCHAEGRVQVCEGKGAGTLNVLFLAEHAPERLLFSAPFKLRVACDEASPYVAKLNAAVRMSVATCDHQTLFVDTAVLVPQGGLLPRELVDYLTWWSDEVVRALERAGTREILVSGDEDSDVATPPMRGDKL